MSEREIRQIEIEKRMKNNKPARRNGKIVQRLNKELRIAPDNSRDSRDCRYAPASNLEL